MSESQQSSGLVRIRNKWLLVQEYSASISGVTPGVGQGFVSPLREQDGHPKFAMNFILFRAWKESE